MTKQAQDAAADAAMRTAIDGIPDALFDAAREEFEAARADVIAVAQLFGDTEGTADDIVAVVRRATAGWEPGRMLRALRWVAYNGPKAAEQGDALAFVAGIVAGLIDRVARDRWTEAEARADAAEATLVTVGAAGFGGGPKGRM